MTDTMNEGTPTPAEAGNTEPPEGNIPNSIPYERFKAVIDEKNRLKERLTHLEEQQREYESLARELAQERATATRQRIAAELHLPPGLASRLQGTTEDEIRADAQALLDALPSPKAPNIDSERAGHYIPPIKPLKDMTQDELEALYDRDPDEFRRRMRAAR